MAPSWLKWKAPAWLFLHTTEKTSFWKGRPTGRQPLVVFWRLFFGCLATGRSLTLAELSFCFLSLLRGQTAELMLPVPRAPDLDPLGGLALCGHSFATCSGGCGWLGSDSGVWTWGTDWPAGGTVGMGQPVRILGLGEMGMEEWLWWSLRADG